MAKSFQERSADLSGIINGCDYGDWDPTSDPLIPVNYSQTDLAGKLACKLALQQKAGLAQNDWPRNNFV